MEPVDPFSGISNLDELCMQPFSEKLFGPVAVKAYCRAYNGDRFSCRWAHNILVGHRIGQGTAKELLPSLMQSAFVRAVHSGRQGEHFWKRVQRSACGHLLGAIRDPDSQREVAKIAVQQFRQSVSQRAFLFMAGFYGYYAVDVSDQGYLGSRELNSNLGSFRSTETNFGPFDRYL